MELTVGFLENKLRKFPKGTSITVSCGCCQHGALGNETILDIKDKTNQTYGYIELELNASSKAEKELSVDKEEFFEKRIKTMQEIIDKQNIKLDRYKGYIESNISDANRALKGRF